MTYSLFAAFEWIRRLESHYLLNFYALRILKTRANSNVDILSEICYILFSFFKINSMKGSYMNKPITKTKRADSLALEKILAIGAVLTSQLSYCQKNTHTEKVVRSKTARAVAKIGEKVFMKSEPEE